MLASAVEPVVWKVVERVLNKPALIAAELERRKEGTSAQQADLDRERQQYAQQITQCEKDMQRWERVDDQQHLIEQAELETVSLMKYCARVLQKLHHLTLEEKRRALEALNIVVTWRPEETPEIHGSISVGIVSRTFP